MRHLHSLDDCSLEASWVTIGSFDGVHRGHQAIIHALSQGAHVNQVPSVVVTFFPQPAVVLGKVKGPFYLTMPEQRAGIFADLGIDVIITLPFTNQIAALTALEFMEKISNHIGIQELWIGEGFRLGRDRQGDAETLHNIGTTLGYKVKTIPHITLDNQRISSSQIRGYLSAGNVRHAATLLGRNYAILGEVIHGAGRGKTLGYPTANLETAAGQLIPKCGVYATWIWVNQIRHLSVSSIGYNPTFPSSQPTLRIETFIINFNEDIYNTHIELQFVDYIRPELKFGSAADLVKQMDHDKSMAEEILSNE